MVEGGRQHRSRGCEGKEPPCLAAGGCRGVRYGVWLVWLIAVNDAGRCDHRLTEFIVLLVCHLCAAPQTDWADTWLRVRSKCGWCTYTRLLTNMPNLYGPALCLPINPDSSPYKLAPFAEDVSFPSYCQKSSPCEHQVTGTLPRPMLDRR